MKNIIQYAYLRYLAAGNLRALYILLALAALVLAGGAPDSGGGP